MLVLSKLVFLLLTEGWVNKVVTDLATDTLSPVTGVTALVYLGEVL